MPDQITAKDFEDLALAADLSRQAKAMQQAQTNAVTEREVATRKLNEMSMGTSHPVDMRNVPQRSAGWTPAAGPPPQPQGELLDPGTFEQQQFRSRAERPGVPLDTASGMPFSQRALASQVPDDPEAQIAFWKGKLGSDKVDLINGRYVLRNVQKKDGSVADISVDEEGLSAGDFADALRSAPELITSIALSTPGPGAAAGRGGQLLKYAVWPAVKSALGFQATQQSKDLVGRLWLDVPVKPEQVMSGIEQAGWDALFGTALAAAPIGVGALANTARKSLTKPAAMAAAGMDMPQGLVQAEGILARENIAAATGNNIEVSSGQLTGFAPLIRFQQIAEKVPFFGSRIAAAKARQAVGEREVQRFLISSEPEAEALGRALITELRVPLQRAEQELSEMKKFLGDESSAKLAQAFSLNTPERSGFEAALGLKQGADFNYQEWRAENSVNYGKVYELPQATDRSIPVEPVKKRLDDIVLERQAKREMTMDLPPGESTDLPTRSVGDPNDISLGGLVEQPIRGTLPSGIESLSRQIQGLGPHATLQELVDLRGRIQDAISNPDILPGVDDFMRKQLSSAITGTIKDYTDRASNRELKQALEFANQRYAEKVDLFDSPGVRDLLRPREGRHAINLDEYASSIFRGGKGAVDRYQRVKSLLGTGSNEVRGFRSYFLQQLGKSAVNPVTRSLDFETLADTVTKVPKEIATDLFPQSREAILEAVRAGQFARGKLDFDMVSELMSKDQLTRTGIQQIATKQSQLDDTVRNQIMRSVRDGKIDDISVQPDAFLDTILLSPKVPASQRKDILDLIHFRNPALSDQIAAKYMSKLFRQSADTSAQENITLAALGRVERVLDPKKFSEAFNGPEKQALLRDVVGEQRFKILNDFSKHLATRSYAQDVAGAAGGLFGSNFLLNILSMKNWTTGIKLGAMSALLSDSKLLRLMTTPPPSGVALPLWNKYLLRTAVLTPEFRRSLAAEFSDEELTQAAQQIQESTKPPVSASPAQ